MLANSRRMDARDGCPDKYSTARFPSLFARIDFLRATGRHKSGSVLCQGKRMIGAIDARKSTEQNRADADADPWHARSESARAFADTKVYPALARIAFRSVHFPAPVRAGDDHQSWNSLAARQAEVGSGRMKPCAIARWPLTELPTRRSVTTWRGTTPCRTGDG
jgi:hypothetical protein